LGRPVAQILWREPERIGPALRKAVHLLRRGGLRGLKHALIERSRSRGNHQVDYQAWIEEFDRLDQADRASIRQRIESMPLRPRFSVVMPVYETPERWLRRAIESVSEQLYDNWELCIADDASKSPQVRRVLEEAAAGDPRIRVSFRDQNGHIARASNTALELATGDFVALLDHDDELPPHALYVLAEELRGSPDLDLLYSDEDKIDEAGDRYDPYFKPDWNPDLLHSQNYLSHLGVYRTSVVRQLGGFRVGTEGSQDYDLCLRVAKVTHPSRIRHIPHVLYHWRAVVGSTAAGSANKAYASRAAMGALREHLAEFNVEILPGALPTTYRVRYPVPTPPPLTSLIIPTRDGLRLLELCLSSIRAKTEYQNYELLVVDNQSRDRKTLAYLNELAESGQARVLKFDAAFNFSAINNFAVGQARGEVVCLLNNDVEVISPDWLGELVSQSLRPGIGAVGAKLLYPGETLQHAGVVAGLFGVAGHVFRGLPRAASGYFGRAQLVQGLSGVTGACLAVRRSTFLEVGGLEEEHLKVAFSDVDFCLRLGAAGYQNLYTPYAELYHLESASRGLEDTPEKLARFHLEIAYMKKRWGPVLPEDPAYNPNLSLQSLQMELAWPPRITLPWRRPATADNQ